MRRAIGVGLALAVLTAGLPAAARHKTGGFRALLDQTVAAARLGPRQEVRVFTTSLAPGERVGRHYHPGILTFYVLQGAFTVEFEGKPPKTVRAGEAMVEPPSMPHKGYNPSTTEPTVILNIYVSNPGEPVAVPAH